MNEGDFMFPVEELSVTLDGPRHLGNRLLKLHPDQDYKAIVRTDTNEVISVVGSNYQLVSNERLITTLCEELKDRQIPAFIDESHSYVNSQHMRLQINFPEFMFHDGASEIALCLFLHNSYDGSESVRFVFGAIRETCGNGMVTTETLTEYSFRHCRGVNIERNVSKAFTAVINQWPLVEERVKVLVQTPFTTEMYSKVERIMGKDWGQYLRSEQPETLWVAYNLMTGFISHQFLKDYRAKYQQGVSKVFAL